MIDTPPEQLADVIRNRFTTKLPLLPSAHARALKAEIKPYLQPFEEKLALRELRALLNPSDVVTEEHGTFVVDTDVDETILLERLTYWQRIGREEMVPTRQKIIEFTQTGLAKAHGRSDLHNARRLRYGPHDVHEYRGKFFPQLVKSLINVSGLQHGSIVLDPMCGSGTTLCEAIVSGHTGVGADLNPLSVLISRVKCSIVSLEPRDFQRSIDQLLPTICAARGSISRIWNPEDLEYLQRWFDPKCLEEIGHLSAGVSAVVDSVYRDFLFVCLSNVIRPLSWQKESDLRVRKELKPYEPGSAAAAFSEQVITQRDKIFPYLCVLPREPRSDAVIKHGNSVEIDTLLADYAGRCDLLITSPPYATALPYLDTDRLSLIALNLLDRKSHRLFESRMIGTREVSEKERALWWSAYEMRRHELPPEVSELIDRIAERNHRTGVGFRRRNLPALLGRYFLAMLDAMRGARRMMKSGSYAYYVVGNNSTVVESEKVEIPTDRFLYEVGDKAGWTKTEFIPMELIASRDIFRENRGSSETVLVFRA